MRLRLGSPCTRACSNDCPPGPRRTDSGPRGCGSSGYSDAHQRPDSRADNRPCAFRSPSSSDGNSHVRSCGGQHPSVHAIADSCPCAHDRTRDASSGSADSCARDISSGSADSRARSGCCDRDPGTSAYCSAAYRNSNTAPIAHSRAADIHAGAAHVYTCANRYHGARRDRQGRQQGW